LGDWQCQNCGLKRKDPDLSNLKTYPLDGIYNKYNTLASVLAAKILGIDSPEKYLKDFQPAFGRQEEINYQGKIFKLFLSKNPTSFNQSLQTIMHEKPSTLLFVLNDRIPDGRDVSWIWDTDIEKYSFSDVNVVVSGDRVYGMAVRLKYGMKDTEAKPFEKLDEAVDECVKVAGKDTVYLLPTYSAMLDVRKLLKGKKIL
jgi:UDP-N-acetylmuramyl tripeptide synthase